LDADENIEEIFPQPNCEDIEINSDMSKDLSDASSDIIDLF